MTIQQTTRSSQTRHDAQALYAAAGSSSPAHQPRHDAHMWNVGGGINYETTRSGQQCDDLHAVYAAAGSDHRPDQREDDTQLAGVGPVPTLPQAKPVTDSIHSAPAGESSGSSQSWNDAHQPNAAAGASLPADHPTRDTQVAPAGGESNWSGSAATTSATPSNQRTSLSDPLLALAADVLDDAENSRKANENRLRQLTRSKTDKDGLQRGFGLDETHPDVARLAALVDMLKQVEHQAELNLARLLRQHPLGPWVKAQKGIGDKQGARLLAVIGDPYINQQTGQPRTVSQLWAYCGHGDPARRKFKGMTQQDLFTLGNPVAKSRTWLISTAVLKAQGPLAAIYYTRKAATEGRLHTTPCVRCGPAGKPAQPGTPWSNAHRHADALRVLGKAILRDMWKAARDIHEGKQP